MTEMKKIGDRMAINDSKYEKDVKDLQWLLYSHWQVAGFVPFLDNITARQKELLVETSKLGP